MESSTKKKKKVPGTNKKARDKSPGKKSPKKQASKKLDDNTKVDSNTQDASLDFEAGVIFHRYDKNNKGVLSPEEFRQMWREARNSTSPGRTAETAFKNQDDLVFEAGQVFSKYDDNKDGKLDKRDFERMVREHPELLRIGTKENETAVRREIPTEVVTGHVLTHFDETAGVAISRAAIEGHRAMGNTVLPLMESYRNRYDRLRSSITIRLLPRREHLLQLRRQLQNCSDDVTASCKAIERETIADTEQILERLHTAESMRQSAIRHQV